MVKELEDAPRDEGRGAARRRTPPEWPGRRRTRRSTPLCGPAGSILLAQVPGRGRRSILALNSAVRETQAVTSDGPEWQARASRCSPPPSPMRAHPGGGAARLGRRAGGRGRSRLVVITSPDRAGPREPFARGARAHAPARRPRPCRRRELRGRAAPAGAGPPAPAGGRGGPSPWCGGGGGPGGSAEGRESPGRTLWLLRATRSRESCACVSAARTVAVTAPALVVVALAWLRLESPVAPLWRPLALVALAARSRRPSRGRSLRLLGAVLATVAAARIAVGVDLVPGVAHGASKPGGRGFEDGFSDFYSTHLPFDPRVHVAMAEARAGRRLCVLARSRLARGGAEARRRRPSWSYLEAGLACDAPRAFARPSRWAPRSSAQHSSCSPASGSRRIPALALPAVAVVAGRGCGRSGRRRRRGTASWHWQTWKPGARGDRPCRRRLRLGTPSTAALTWPADPTVVLDVQSGAERPAYLRAGRSRRLRRRTGGRSACLARADSLEPAAALQAAQPGARNP